MSDPFRKEPDKHEYEFRFDRGGGYQPTEAEKAMLEDFANGLLSAMQEQRVTADGLTFIGPTERLS